MPCEPAATVICVCLGNSSSWNLHRNVRALMTLTVHSKLAVTARGLSLRNVPQFSGRKNVESGCYTEGADIVSHVIMTSARML